MRRIVIAPALLFTLALGCGGGGEGEVSGKITYRNKPVPGGAVTFRHADGRHNPITVELDENGNYPPVKLPVGDVSVLIDNSSLEAPVELSGPSLGGFKLPDDARKAMKEGAPPRGGSSKRSARYVPLPDKYRTAETSGLTFKVERGVQKKDFELTD